MQTLKFPSASLGRVYISDPSVGERFLGQAQGELVIPSDRRVRLQVAASAVSRLKELQRLSADAINCVSVAGTSINDRQLSELGHLTGLSVLCFEHTPIDGSAFEALSGLHQLEKITGWWSRVRDANMRHLANFAQLQSLDLSQTPLTDAGVPFLEPLTDLRTLSLMNTSISNKSIEILCKLRSLEALSLAGTTVDKQGVAELLKLPMLKTFDLANDEQLR